MPIAGRTALMRAARLQTLLLGTRPDFSRMKIAVTLSVMLLVVGSAKFSGAQEPSPTPDASPIATPTATPTPTPTPTASPTPTAKPTSAATPRPPTGLRVLH